MKILAATATFFVLASPAVAGTVVKASYNATLKTTILTDAHGMAVYEYASDVKNVKPFPFCIDDAMYHCSKHWLPLLTTGAPVAGKGVQKSLLSTADRDDGTTQVMYRGHPLYTWKGGYGTRGDRKAGDVWGQAFLGLWYVMSPAGKPILKANPTQRVLAAR
jgi:predicted lipoprotein with Yx(FWY)xxD motif